MGIFDWYAFNSPDDKRDNPRPGTKRMNSTRKFIVRAKRVKTRKAQRKARRINR